MNPSEPDPLSPATPPPLRPASLLLRLGVIGLILAIIVGLFLYAGGWFTPHSLSPKVLINTLESGGLHPGFRRNHAKGVCVSGFFESNGRGAELSHAVVFAPGRVPVLGRLALAGGQPYQADAAHTVRSMALLFKLPDGEEWRTGMNNIPVFPVDTPQGFYDLLIASNPDPATGKPDPAKMGALMAAHPEAARAFPLIGANPISSGFANSTYHGLNAFLFTNAQGATTPVRWSMVPVQPFEPIPAAAPEKAEPNALFDALIASIHAGPLQWKLIVTVGQAGDATKEASVPWPSDRQKVEVGVLTLDHVESEDTSPARDINFDPLILPSGISGSDDPLLSARSAAYARSFTRREGEPKAPSAVSTAETQK